MLTSPPATFRAHYKALVASGAIEADPAQAAPRKPLRRWRSG